MKLCKKCRSVISLDLSDILKGEAPAPKCVDKESIKKQLCKECNKSK